MDGEQRFKGAMAEEYKLLNSALPHFEKLQGLVGDAVAEFSRRRGASLQVLDVGCGSGATSSSVLEACADALLTSLDNEEEMLVQARSNLESFIDAGRCKVVLRDALEFLKEQPPRSFDVVATALTLHNMAASYRREVHAAIFRVLRPGGLFVNADKYAPQEDAERFQALQAALERFFEAFVPLGKLDLLKQWVLHNVADQAPGRVMKEEDTVSELAAIGFREIRIVSRFNMEAVLRATAGSNQGNENAGSGLSA